ncbi:MAG: cell wall hydrolase, partial [Caulobacter sp.]
MPSPRRQPEFRAGLKAAAALIAVGGLSACATAYHLPRQHGRAAGVAGEAGALSDAGLARYVADMDPAMLALARRHDPRPHRDYWGRVKGWEVIEIATIPTLGDTVPGFDDARRINAYRLPAPLPIEAARPFVLKASGDERARALHCLTQAVYFEAGFEPAEGQQAVAQTVLNRLRHPGYPKSVCGVIYEGSLRATGCQFSFTCDGSLERAVSPTLWNQAQAVARRALSGFVMKDVGVATHYHADYVAPYWAPTLVKLKQVGTHIFYRWTGPSGALAAFRGRYAGGESRISAATLMGADPRTLEAAPPQLLAQEAMSQSLAQTLGGPAPAGALKDARIVVIPDVAAPGGERLKVEGSVAGRRIATPEEIARINKALEAMPEVQAQAAA